MTQRDLPSARDGVVGRPGTLTAERLEAFVGHLGRLADRTAALPDAGAATARDRQVRLGRLRAAHAAGLQALVELGEAPQDQVG